MGHGGRREGAGRKPKFSRPADRVVRVPSSVADQVLAIAAILDAYADQDLPPDLVRRAIMAEIEAILR